MPAPGRRPSARENPVPASPYVICLDDAGRAELESVPGAPRRRSGWCCGRGSCCWPRTGGRTPRSPPGWASRGTGPQVAQAVLRGGPGRVGRSPADRRPRAFPPVAVVGVKALACELPAESGVPLPGGAPRAGRGGGRPRHRRGGLGVHGAPLAGRGRPQALAAPVVDLPAGPATSRSRPPGCWICTPGHGRASRWARTSSWSARTRRPRPGPVPLPPHAARRAGPDDAGRARVPARGRAGLPGRLRRAPRPGDRPVEPTTGIEPFTGLVAQVMTSRAVCPRGAGVLGGGQRLLAPRTGLGQRMSKAWPTAAAGAPARARLLVGPGRDLLLRPPAQGADPQRLDRPGRPRRADLGLPGSLQRHRHPVRLDIHPHRPRPAPGRIGGTTGTHRTRPPHEPRRINGRDHEKEP